jgi:hypothetical protein
MPYKDIQKYRECDQRRNQTEARREYKRRYLAKPGVLEKKRATAREWHYKNAKRSWENALRWRHGQKAVEYYHERLFLQTGRCAICEEIVLDLVMDHDHRCCNRSIGSCGKCLRGLLCQNCNVGIGAFRDDPIRLEKAIKYLGGYWG